MRCVRAARIWVSIIIEIMRVCVLHLLVDLWVLYYDYLLGCVVLCCFFGVAQIVVYVNKPNIIANRREVERTDSNSGRQRILVINIIHFKW